jgi:hypothetical protein
MARKRELVEATYLLYDVVYEDGSRSSNRKVRSNEVDPLDRTGSIRALLERQDRKIAEASGKSRGPVKSVSVSAS